MVKFLASFVFIIGCLVSSLFGQNEKRVDQTSARISTNVPVTKQTQGATFGERINSGTNKSRTKIEASRTFAEPIQIEVFSTGERDSRNNVIVDGLTVNGTVLLKSARVSGGAGDRTASVSSNIKVTIKQAETGDQASAATDKNGNFSLTLLHDTLHTIYVNGVEYGKVKLMKTKHDTVKNSINNVR